MHDLWTVWLRLSHRVSKALQGWSLQGRHWNSAMKKKEWKFQIETTQTRSIGVYIFPKVGLIGKVSWMGKKEPTNMPLSTFPTSHFPFQPCLLSSRRPPLRRRRRARSPVMLSLSKSRQSPLHFVHAIIIPLSYPDPSDPRSTTANHLPSRIRLKNYLYRWDF